MAQSALATAFITSLTNSLSKYPTLAKRLLDTYGITPATPDPAALSALTELGSDISARAPARAYAAAWTTEQDPSPIGAEEAGDGDDQSPTRPRQQPSSAEQEEAHAVTSNPNLEGHRPDAEHTQTGTTTTTTLPIHPGPPVSSKQKAPEAAAAAAAAATTPTTPSSSSSSSSQPKRHAHVLIFATPNPWPGKWHRRATHILDVAYLFLNYASAGLIPTHSLPVAHALASDVLSFTSGRGLRWNPFFFERCAEDDTAAGTPLLLASRARGAPGAVKGGKGLTREWQQVRPGKGAMVQVYGETAANAWEGAQEVAEDRLVRCVREEGVGVGVVARAWERWFAGF